MASSGCKIYVRGNRYETKSRMHFGLLIWRGYSLLLYITCVMATVQSDGVVRQAVYQDVLVSEGYNTTSSTVDVISGYERMSRIACGIQCSKVDNCQSFSLNSITNQCNFYSELFLETPGAEAPAGTVHIYQKDNHDETAGVIPATSTAGTTATTTETTPTTTLTTTTTTTVTPFQCPTGDNFLKLGSDPDEMCIRFHTDPMIWHDANTNCSNYHPSGRLVVVNTAVRDNLVRDIGTQMDSQFERGAFTIGLRIDGWIDGSPIVYTNWRPGVSFVPGSLECVTYHRSSGFYWNAVDCGTARNYICEIPFQ